MKPFVELLFFFTFFLNFYCLKKKEVSFTVISCIVYLLFGDYLFYHVNYQIGELSFAKLYIEVNLMLLFFFFIVDVIYRKPKLNNYESSFLMYFILSLVFLLYGILNNGIVAAVNGWRSIFSYIFITWLISYFSKDPKHLLQVVIQTIIIVCFINSVYSIYQYITFNGDFSNLWRYNLLLEAKTLRNADFSERMLQYQFVRGDELRASGFFVSPLPSAFFTAIGAILVSNKLLNFTFKPSSVFTILLLIIFLTSAYMSQVRTALVIYSLAILIAAYLKGRRLKKIVFIMFLIFIPIIILSVGIFFESSLDASSAGRIVQYKFLIDSFTLLGAGLGANVAGFDSFYIYTWLDLGVGFFLLLCIFAKYYQHMPISQPQTFFYLEAKRKPLVQSIYITLFPVLAVQYTAGSLYFFSVLIIVSLTCMVSREY